MNDDLQKQIEQIMSFARYLSWADLLDRMYQAEMAREIDVADADALKEHEWRSFGLMCYWYSSLYVVIEAWDRLAYSDPIIDQLLANPRQFRKLLKRFRNAVFHFQESLIDPRFVELMVHGAVHVHWILALHREFMRFLADYLSNKMITEEQRSELRGDIEATIHWYPYREAPQVESLERTLARGRELLAKYPADQSAGRMEIEYLLESTEAILREGKRNWAILRAQMLREAGVQGVQ